MIFAHLGRLGFQDGASPGFTGCVELQILFFFICCYFIGSIWLLGSIIYFYNNSKIFIIHN